MKKYFLFAFLFVTLIVSCEKDNVEPEPLDTVETAVIKQYISKDELELYQSYVIGTDTNFIFPFGVKDNKLIIKGFNKRTKENIWSFVSKRTVNIGKEVTINKGYGETETYKIDRILITLIFKDDNNYIIQEGEYSQGLLMTNFIHFIPNGVEVKMSEYKRSGNDNPFFLSHLIKWYDKSVLAISNPDNFAQCLDYSGKLLTAIASINSFGFLSPSYLAISYEAIIRFYNGNFVCQNLKENQNIWTSKQPLKDLPSNIRIDKTTFEVIDKDFTKCTFNYTLFEGDKKIIAFKINNSTGEFVQL
ncbi:hypothetical protein DSECCO2_146470 [anaerobic digester metagenome]